MASCSIILPWQAANFMVSIAYIWSAQLLTQRVESAFHFPGVELLPSNQLQTTHQCLSNFNNQDLGSSAVKIDKDFGLVRESFIVSK